jgi:hypothetical protein
VAVAASGARSRGFILAFWQSGKIQNNATYKLGEEHLHVLSNILTRHEEETECAITLSWATDSNRIPSSCRSSNRNARQLNAGSLIFLSYVGSNNALTHTSTPLRFHLQDPAGRTPRKRRSPCSEQSCCLVRRTETSGLHRVGAAQALRYSVLPDQRRLRSALHNDYSHMKQHKLSGTR